MLSVYYMSCFSDFSGRKKLEKTITDLGFEPRFVESFSENDAYLKDYYVGEQGENDFVGVIKKYIAGYASHLSALKEFLLSGEKFAIICEDNVKFHPRFKNYIDYIPKNDNGFVYLSTLPPNNYNYLSVSKASTFDHGLCQFNYITPTSGCYLVSRQFAKTTIFYFDRKINNIYLGKISLTVKNIRPHTHLVFYRNKFSLEYPIAIYDPREKSKFYSKAEIETFNSIYMYIPEYDNFFSDEGEETKKLVQIRKKLIRDPLDFETVKRLASPKINELYPVVQKYLKLEKKFA